MPTPLRATLPGVIAALLAASCWALSGIFIKLILVDAGISSFALAQWRDTAAFVVFFSIGVIIERRRMFAQSQASACYHHLVPVAYFNQHG